MSRHRKPKLTGYLTRRFDFYMTDEMYERICVRLQGGRLMPLGRYIRECIQRDLDEWRDARAAELLTDLEDPDGVRTNIVP